MGIYDALEGMTRDLEARAKLAEARAKENETRQKAGLALLPPILMPGEIAPQPPAQPQPSADTIEIKDRQVTIRIGGTVHQLTSVRGWKYLEILWSERGREFGAAELQQRVDGVHSESHTPGDGVNPVTGATADPVADQKAIKLAHQALERAEEDADIAREKGRPDEGLEHGGRAKEIRAWLADSEGLGGRQRLFPEKATRVQDSVKKAITRALDEVTQEIPALGKPLAALFHCESGRFVLEPPRAAGSP